MLLPNSLATLSAVIEGEARGRAVVTWAAAGAIGGAIAPMLGGWLIDTIGWPFIFLLNLPIALAAILLGLRFVPESRNMERPPPDWMGGALATFSLGALTWGLTAWSASDRLDSVTIGSLAAGTAMLVFFLRVEHRRGGEAMVPLAMFGARAFVGLTLFTFLLYGALGGLMLLFPYVLIEAGGYSPTLAGAALLPLPVVIALGSPLMGRLAARMGPRWPLTVGPAIVAGGFALMLMIDARASYWSDILPSLLAISGGMAIAVAPLTTAVLSAVEESHVGTASGLNSAVSRTGGLIAVALLGGVLSQSGAALICGFHGGALVGAGLALASALMAFATLGKLRVED
jgi:MFS family permease